MTTQELKIEIRDGTYVIADSEGSCAYDAYSLAARIKDYLEGVLAYNLSGTVTIKFEK